MNQNPDMKRVSQRSLFARVVHKPFELPIHKQHELQTAIAELVVNALTEVPVKEANIDDDEQ
jgi:anti-sigma regulatory factor (Ser/Thr protein kinase)